MNNRVKELRQALDMTMEKFGERLGVKKTAISLIESGKNSVTEQMLRSICREFGVNEDWLREGKGEMFSVTRDEYIEKLSRSYGFNEFDEAIIRAYMDLDQETRDVIKNYVLKVSALYKNKEGIEEQEDIQTKIDTEVENYRKELEAEALGKGKSLASGVINASENKRVRNK